MVKPVRYIGTPTGTQLPALPSAAEATMVAPAFSASEFVDNLTAGLGMALGDRVEGLGQMVTHPVNTAREFANTLMTVARNPRRAGNALLDAAVSGAKRASSGPLGFGEVAGQFLPMPKAPTVLRNELIVHHGTPHRFPATEANPLGEFDASKIGTGEGAQAFGHGIYLAENPTVAQNYQFMLSEIDPNTVTYQGKPAEKWYEMAQAEQDRAHRLKDRAAIDRANAKLAYWENVMTRRHPEDVKRVANDPDDGWKEFANYANSLDMKKFGGIGEAGSLYKADLPDEMIDKMLDWDKPLSQQSVAVKEMLRKSPLAPDESVWPQWTGQQFYEAEVRAMTEFDKLQKGPSRASVSDAMRQAGIPGIKYLDEGSRGQDGSGTRNFVVFPGEEKKVRILERK